MKDHDQDKVQDHIGGLRCDADRHTDLLLSADPEEIICRKIYRYKWGEERVDLQIIRAEPNRFLICARRNQRDKGACAEKADHSDHTGKQQDDFYGERKNSRRIFPLLLAEKNGYVDRRAGCDHVG